MPAGYTASVKAPPCSAGPLAAVCSPPFMNSTTLCSEMNFSRAALSSGCSVEVVLGTPAVQHLVRGLHCSSNVSGQLHWT